ncbi:tRNA (guanosine(46)-N7)-methyltransferase TrmB [Weissella tructae]|uniref:tRNA (guanine-N(7)-)-methyltransferase n=2 Tax=Weissella TaxID=46255 RepID=A0A075TZ65_9LACO|nr:MULTISPECIES: tRNA (guanosine(46)-N7)-methyltransferase TrmB [Weissella]AIG65530.1 tRNA (guanine-N(7)-)-methyltransferase [Weissella tructae]AIM62844.1 tRNA (guanine-N(7)-)-methyltransferase [Weissella ceti]AIM64179.1 tRNA (guanine-N(7)-)-methyltransferase [Weissella ceti]ELA07010.1 tRNA (guanine-N(7)-)-methyltransferase [Weissella ceti NC36]QVV91902.1 tRNA (guanosine(46)-N7)-methyltransferase TrmB [Weissella tructae]
MRLRKKMWAGPWIDDHADLVVTQKRATDMKGKWAGLFAKEQPIHIEVGTGKGQFIVGMAKKYPDTNFIGMEIQESAVAVAARKADEDEDDLPNLKFIYGDGAGVDTYFEKGEVAKVFLNFSDPWPKSRHETRRLTYKSFLEGYEAILPEGGELEFKTDNRGLFEYSLYSFAQYGITFLPNGISLDLHADEDKMVDNVETEYEQKFSERGFPIYKFQGAFKKAAK